MELTNLDMIEREVFRLKEFGQVWTPDYIVKFILDEVGYTIGDEGILEAKILEPSFGEGVFLYEIFYRLIKTAEEKGYSEEEITDLLNNVHGVELDEDLYEKTVKEIKRWLEKEFGVVVRELPNLLNQDTLEYNLGGFNYVVGNPPYVRIQNINRSMRKKLKRFRYSTGNSDLYIIFYEIGLNLLREGGVLAYIAPNSWIKNSSQRGFREDLIRNKYVRKIIDFGSEKVFEDVGTYTAISIFEKSEQGSFVYSRRKKDLQEEFMIEKSVEEDDVFVFYPPSGTEVREIQEDKDLPQLRDLCKVQNGVATLGDQYYVYDPDLRPELNEEFTRSLVKSSTYKGEEMKERIIFPYKKSGERLVGATEGELRESSPNIWKHLSKYKSELSERSLDRGSLWFWFGRSQAIQETPKRKLIFSPIVGPDQRRVRTFIVPEDTVVYSGLFITELENDDGLFPLPSTSLEEIAEILESREFCDYAKIMGKDMSGGYKAINSTIVRAYRFR